MLRGRYLLVSVLALGLNACVGPYQAAPAPVGTIQGQGASAADGTAAGQTDARLTRAAQSLMAGLLHDADVQQQTSAEPVALYLHPVSLSQGDAQPLNEALRRSLVNSGRITLVTAPAGITEQLEYHQAGGATPAALVRLAKRAGARWMLYGGLDEQGRLAMQLIDLKGGEWLWSGYRTPR